MLPNEIFVPRSSLTRKQAVCLESYVRVINHEIKLREAAAIVEGGPITIGSYYRTVGQGRKNVKESVATIAVALSLGIMDYENLNRLLRLVVPGTPQPSKDDPKLDALLVAILNQLVK